VAKAGDEITFKVPLKGPPLSTPVLATHDRFSQSKVTYPYYTETADDGNAGAKITRPVLWTMRIEINVPEAPPSPSRTARWLSSSILWGVVRHCANDNSSG
jgi:hypothetical protein